MTFHVDDEMRRDLREPFPKEQIGTLPKTEKRPALDFVGHAAVTDRLNKAAPDWHYSILERFDANGKCWVRGAITIGGVRREEYGDGDDPKDAIGNFIRRGAMRFGVAIDLWSREELPAPTQESGSPGDRYRGASSPGTSSGGGDDNAHLRGEGERAAPIPPPDTSSSVGEQKPANGPSDSAPADEVLAATAQIQRLVAHYGGGKKGTSLALKAAHAEHGVGRLEDLSKTQAADLILAVMES